MGKPPVKTEDELLKQQMAADEQARVARNAERAKKSADELFPDEKWNKVEDGIYVSSRRPIGQKSNYVDEKRDAKILRSFGSTVYLTPEARGDGLKKYDAIVNGLQFEFKNVGGNGNTLEMQFLKSRTQAPNVFINLETSKLSKHEIMASLYGARNKRTTSKSKGYDHYNSFSGGRIILKVKGHKSLIYLNVDDLKIKRQ